MLPLLFPRNLHEFDLLDIQEHDWVPRKKNKKSHSQYLNPNTNAHTLILSSS